MKQRKRPSSHFAVLMCFLVVWFIIPAGFAAGGDLDEIKQRGVLRHLGVPYANFVTGSGDGLDVELVKLFAQHLSVRYEYVETNWDDTIADLTGKMVDPMGEDILVTGDTPVKGDLIASGLTILAWRQKIVDYSIPTFPNQVWVIAGADSLLQPIQPSGEMDKDIAEVKGLLKGRVALCKVKTCLDPSLYRFEESGIIAKPYKGGANELAPAVIRGDAETSILDVPDALVALGKWPGKIKVIGPISQQQEMAYAFAKTSPELRQAFNDFFEQCKTDGTYMRLIKKYYPVIESYFPLFFSNMTNHQ